ncbi:MAG: hypothetical protein D0528_09300 [Methylococcales bacterium]|nr:MAG: hypothetical protein D0528_09300 [Methylococcales bacterium]
MFALNITTNALVLDLEHLRHTLLTPNKYPFRASKVLFAVNMDRIGVICANHLHNILTLIKNINAKPIKEQLKEQPVRLA